MTSPPIMISNINLNELHTFLKQCCLKCHPANHALCLFKGAEINIKFWQITTVFQYKIDLCNSPVI